MQEWHDNTIYIGKDDRSQHTLSSPPSSEAPTGAWLSPAVNGASTRGSQLTSQQPRVPPGSWPAPCATSQRADPHSVPGAHHESSCLL